jgi:hypothetical protein
VRAAITDRQKEVVKDVQATVSWEDFQGFVKAIVQVKPEEVREPEKGKGARQDYNSVKA